MSEEKKENKQESVSKGLIKIGKIISVFGYLLFLLVPYFFIHSIEKSGDLFAGIVDVMLIVLSIFVVIGIGKMFITISAIEINTRNSE